jgi:flagellum-specific ATP synthase
MNLAQSDEKTINYITDLAELSIAGKVCNVSGPVIKVRGLNAKVGQQIDLWPEKNTLPIAAEAIGLSGDQTLLMALDSVEGIAIGTEATSRGNDILVPVGDELLGRVVDGMGNPLDGGPIPHLPHRCSLKGVSPNPMDRTRINSIMPTGIRILDSILTMGHGQRVGIFAGAGAGKTTLLSMLARHGDFEVCVIGLIGERGREVREFIEDAINNNNRKRTCVVAVTGDKAPLLKIRGALYATAIAEHFRSKGKKVVLLFDSLTRYAMAQREVGLAGGELPATKGYPPSVFVEMARLLERAGNDSHGSITGLYTVLVEGDDLSDPVADSSRALLDGHVVLSRDMGNRGIYPAVDILASKSRLMSQLSTPEHINITRAAISMVAQYQQAEDLIRIGAYKAGSDPGIDNAIKFMPEFLAFINQNEHQKYTVEESNMQLKKIVNMITQKKTNRR